MNNLTISGYVGQEPEFKVIDKDKKVCEFNLGVRHDKETTVWYTVEVWGSRTEQVYKNLPLRKRIIVEGILKPQPRAWVDADGNAQTRYEVYANSVEW